MKKILIFIVLLYIWKLTFYTTNVFAQTATPKAIKTSEAPAESQINKLKDRIASRVAELKLVERKGTIGTVSEISNIQLTLVDKQNNTHFIDVDELTKFASPSAKEAFGISDIAKGNTIGILGLYNKQTRRLLARFIDILVLPKIIHGAIAEIDNENYTLQVINSDKEKFIIDVQTTTKISSYTKAGDVVKSGFSKIKKGQRIMVVGFVDKKNKAKIIPNRIILFINLPINPKITLPSSLTTKETITPTITSTSAKKTTK